MPGDTRIAADDQDHTEPADLKHHWIPEFIYPEAKDLSVRYPTTSKR